MRHRNRRGKLGRKSEHRLMMLRNLATSLFDKERIQTTMPKAKQLRPFAEKLITVARKQDLSARRYAARYIHDKKVLGKLFDEIAKRHTSDNGGYTRIVPYRARWGDGAELAFIELKNAVLPEKVTKETKKKAAAKKETPAAEKAAETKTKRARKGKAENGPSGE
ncbi:MAG TPA: 50S ribosomal protein L17 [Acidobacteriota bacterium]|nr:50S ribosomal protein L17 [Acidobacteriota bacterium]